MRFVGCGSAPKELKEWEELAEKDSDGFPKWEPYRHLPLYSAVIRKLENAFVVCGYCETECKSNNTIDHLKPQSIFKRDRFKWDNLVYCCKRCNDKKKNKFPNVKEQKEDIQRVRNMAVEQGRQYDTPAEYVNPRSRKDKAERYITFAPSGDMGGSRLLSDPEWSKAERTIVDLKLNHDGGPRKDQLRVQRLEQLFRVIVAYRRDFPIDDFMRRGKNSPFFSFIKFAVEQNWLDETPAEVENYINEQIDKLKKKPSHD